MARKKEHVMNGLEIVEALQSITKEKHISLELAITSLEEALSQAGRKSLKYPADVGIEIDRVTGDISAYSFQTVVDLDEQAEKEEEFDPYTQITVDEAREEYDDDTLKAGDIVVEDENLNIVTFGRSAVTLAKQLIMQRVREHERKKVYDDFSERINELVHGTVQQVERGNVILNIGRTEALLPRSEQIRGERYHQGDTVKGVIKEVKDNGKGAQVIISRTAPEFLMRLFENEVPEVFEGVVRITKVVRAPGYRAKVAVETDDPRVDPVGSCVGMRGNRIQAIVREVSNERMDIIANTDEISMLARRVLASTDVKRVFPVGDKKVILLVADDELARAIGREGQNIRLTSKFLDRTVEIFGEEEFEDMSEEEKAKQLTEPEIEIVDEDSIMDDDELAGDALELGDAEPIDGENIAQKIIDEESDQL